MYYITQTYDFQYVLCLLMGYIQNLFMNLMRFPGGDEDLGGEGRRLDEEARCSLFAIRDSFNKLGLLIGYIENFYGFHS